MIRRMSAPPPPERLVTSDNWLDAPYNRWGFLHVGELARTARIPRGDGPVHELPYAPRDLGSVPVPFEGSTATFAESLERTYADGVCIIHDHCQLICSSAVPFGNYKVAEGSGIDGLRTLKCVIP